MKREGGMGSRALDLCSGTFFARDDDSRSGMIDLEGEAFRCFDFPFSVSSSRADGVLSRSPLSCFLDSYMLTDSFLSLIEQTDTATRPDRTRSASSDFRAAS